jgi:hypothetical protein
MRPQTLPSSGQSNIQSTTDPCRPPVQRVEVQSSRSPIPVSTRCLACSHHDLAAVAAAPPRPAAQQKTHELDVHLNVSNILDQLSSGTLDGNDPRLDGDGNTLGDGERFDRRDILHCECMLMVTIGYSRPLILLSYAQPGGGLGGRGRQKGRKYFSILPESEMSVAATFYRRS